MARVRPEDEPDLSLRAAEPAAAAASAVGPRAVLSIPPHAASSRGGEHPNGDRWDHDYADGDDHADGGWEYDDADDDGGGGGGWSDREGRSGGRFRAPESGHERQALRARQAPGGGAAAWTPGRGHDDGGWEYDDADDDGGGGGGWSDREGRSGGRFRAPESGHERQAPRARQTPGGGAAAWTPGRGHERQSPRAWQTSGGRQRFPMLARYCSFAPATDERILVSPSDLGGSPRRYPRSHNTRRVEVQATHRTRVPYDSMHLDKLHAAVAVSSPKSVAGAEKKDDDDLFDDDPRCPICFEAMQPKAPPLPRSVTGTRGELPLPPTGGINRGTATRPVFQDRRISRSQSLPPPRTSSEATQVRRSRWSRRSWRSQSIPRSGAPVDQSQEETITHSVCGNRFHRSCLDMCWVYDLRCPLCRTALHTCVDVSPDCAMCELDIPPLLRPRHPEPSPNDRRAAAIADCCERCVLGLCCVATLWLVTMTCLYAIRSFEGADFFGVVVVLVVCCWCSFVRCAMKCMTPPRDDGTRANERRRRASVVRRSERRRREHRRLRVAH